ncbi:hypothetical protein Cadr_000018356 [Camelus dromedarius]|uniref:Uncharacterized protein n=1 Tax=Camelus dromedarius TaxID=9838 RepID=A0A5N4D7E6_CAMDR|nr:hypothetical protein Cadr_000018356 [Camelus dromedarius]
MVGPCFLCQLFEETPPPRADCWLSCLCCAGAHAFLRSLLSRGSQRVAPAVNPGVRAAVSVGGVTRLPTEEHLVGLPAVSSLAKAKGLPIQPGLHPCLGPLPRDSDLQALEIKGTCSGNFLGCLELEHGVVSGLGWVGPSRGERGELGTGLPGSPGLPGTSGNSDTVFTTRAGSKSGTHAFSPVLPGPSGRCNPEDCPCPLMPVSGQVGRRRTCRRLDSCSNPTGRNTFCVRKEGRVKAQPCGALTELLTRETETCLPQEVFGGEGTKPPLVLGLVSHMRIHKLQQEVQGRKESQGTECAASTEPRARRYTEHIPRPETAPSCRIPRGPHWPPGSSNDAKVAEATRARFLTTDTCDSLSLGRNQRNGAVSLGASPLSLLYIHQPRLCTHDMQQRAPGKPGHS